jgi:hypothetical protein
MTTSSKTTREYSSPQRYYLVDDFKNPERDNNTESQLFDLYPGKPYPITEIIDRNLLPPEDPALFRHAFLENRRKTAEYQAKLEAVVRNMGGGDAAKVSVRPAVDPDEMIEDPDLKYVVQRGRPGPGGTAEAPFLVPPPIPEPIPQGSTKEGFTTVHDRKPKPTKPKKSRDGGDYYMWTWVGMALLLFFMTIFFAAL